MKQKLTKKYFADALIIESGMSRQEAKACLEILEEAFRKALTAEASIAVAKLGKLEVYTKPARVLTNRYVKEALIPERKDVRFRASKALLTALNQPKQD